MDGSAASGKSTIGRLLAQKLGYLFLDTGVMYRALALAAIERGIDPSDSVALGELARSVRIDVRLAPPGSGNGTAVLLDGTDVTARLRSPAVEEAVSLVSRVPAVRHALVQRQREIAQRGDIVMAGRDIGTVVLPSASLKIYLDAPVEERARRRYAEFASMGRNVTHQMVLDDLRRRDRIDSQRSVSPLRPAEDAVRIDTGGLTLEEVLQKVLVLLDARGGAPASEPAAGSRGQHRAGSR